MKYSATPKNKWRPDPIRRDADLDKLLICHSLTQSLARLLWLTKRSHTFIPYTSPLWLEISRQIKIRDRWRCRSCGGTKTLGVHHIKKIKDGGSNLPSNLKTLCRKCHRARHPEARKNSYVSGLNR